MICPKCGEDNSDNFRFCGMCGTVLETRRAPGTLTLDPQSGFPPGFPPKTTTAPDPVRPAAIENAARLAGKQVPPISGPSMLGLNQPGQSSPRQQSQSGQNQSSMDSLRERAFSGLDSFFEPEQPKTSGRRTLLLVGLLVALGGAGWWTYTNYLGATESRKPDATSVANLNGGDAPADATPAKPAARDAVAAPIAGSSQAATSSPRTQDSSSESGNSGSDAGAKPPAAAKPVIPAPATSTAAKIVPATVPATKTVAKVEPGVTSVRAARLPVAAPADTGDADFRKGEAFLYGRGAAENCDEAMKYLRAASAKSNAKARSMLGTMYDTGHCAPRDLPTSYLWFALALQVDPNNQILEKDLSAVWNQMTPPERQMATRMKQ